MKYLLYIFLFLPVFVFCQTSVSENFTSIDTEAAHPFRLHYDLGKPDAEMKMPDDLEEISGLSLTPDESKLIAVQDEDGEVFFINKRTGEVERDYNFHKEGDYEGVEMVGPSVFIVKSNGKIYELHNVGEDHQQTIKYTTALNKEFDVEGLGYDAKNKRLLLACKEVGEEGDEPILEKSIYAFDLMTRTLIEKPVYVLRLADFLEYLEKNTHVNRHEKMQQHFSEDPDDFKFSASAIAVHPRTGDIYALSSKGKMLGVMSEAGKILHIEKLDKEIHPQPEGLCFEKNGTMYISNEAKNGKDAVIYRFDYLP